MVADVAEAFSDSLLSEFYFSHVEGTDTGDFVARMERSEIRESSCAASPDFAALYPGYTALNTGQYDDGQCLINPCG